MPTPHSLMRAVLFQSAIVIACVRANAVVAAPVRLVVNCDDSGPGSVRDAVANAHIGDIIDLAGLTCGMITLTSGAITTDLDELTLVGPGANALAIDGSGADRVIAGGATTELTLSRLTLINGVVEEADAAGGCVRAAGVFLSEVNLYDCVARATSGTARGGGVWTAYPLQMDHTTISNCAAESTGGEAHGGGAYAGAGLIMDASSVRASVAQSGGAGAPESSGGGVFVALGFVSIRNSTISGNAADYAAGLDLPGPPQEGGPLAIIVNSTVGGNTASIEAGGIRAGRSLRIVNSTIAFNAEPLAPHHGVVHAAGVQLGDVVTLRLESTIIANNRSGSRNLDLNGERSASVLGTHNLITHSVLSLEPGTVTADPLLRPLQNNGGPTATMALSPGSPALGAGSNTLSLTSDQRLRGYPRKVGLAVDIGAVEYGNPLFRELEP